MNFTKMQGCGNDYIYINGFEETIEDPKELAIQMSDRHFGIGSDGIVLILPSQKADVKMRMFNADGSEAEMCGNAIRCVGKYVYDNKMIGQETIYVETQAGIKILELFHEQQSVKTVRVNMGEPILKAQDIPVLSEGSPVVDLMLMAADKKFAMTCVSMGNPHAVTFVEQTDGFNVEKYGKLLEVDASFPKKANIEFAQVINRHEINMRVWERGSGETLACGTGACATLVACVLNDKCDTKATIHLLGGDLDIEWDQETNHVFLTGPAEFVFEGKWLK